MEEEIKKVVDMVHQIPESIRNSAQHLIQSFSQNMNQEDGLVKEYSGLQHELNKLKEVNVILV